MRTEEYMGYTINAHASLTAKGYVPTAIVAKGDHSTRPIEVMPSAKTYSDEAEAVWAAVDWARDRVDRMISWQLHRQTSR